MSDTDRGDGALTVPQRRAAALLAGGADLGEVARSAKVTDRTLRRWRALAAFGAEVEAEIGKLRDAGRRRLTGLIDVAVSALRRVAEDGPAAPAVAAAREILDRAIGRPVAPVEHSGEMANPDAAPIRVVYAASHHLGKTIEAIESEMLSADPDPDPGAGDSGDAYPAPLAPGAPSPRAVAGAVAAELDIEMGLVQEVLVAARAHTRRLKAERKDGEAA